jgi:hypothetical protein
MCPHLGSAKSKWPTRQSIEEKSDDRKSRQRGEVNLMMEGIDIRHYEGRREMMREGEELL